jgi:hypothetical protein
VHSGLWEGNLSRTLGRSRLRWEDNIKMDLKIIGMVVWAGFIWFRIGASGGLL